MYLRDFSQKYYKVPLDDFMCIAKKDDHGMHLIGYVENYNREVLGKFK
jgi:hypothetical protein